MTTEFEIGSIELGERVFSLRGGWGRIVSITFSLSGHPFFGVKLECLDTAVIYLPNGIPRDGTCKKRDLYWAEPSIVAPVKPGSVADQGLSGEHPSPLPAWRKVSDALDKHYPGWMKLTSTSYDSDAAVKAIENLARKAVRIDPTIVKPPVRECPPNNTLVEVADFAGGTKIKRYSAGKLDGERLVCWNSGKTSFTAGGMTAAWKYWNTIEDKDDFIEWTGGECPVYGFTSVEVKLRRGHIAKRLAKGFNWFHSGQVGAGHQPEFDIVGYKIVKG